METQKKEPARRNGDIDGGLQLDGAPSAAALREEVVEILSGAIARLVITGGYRRVTDWAQHVAHDIARGDAR
jgi:isopentenyl diphosphate isomerase/L-lactate dehydrogenase-like FMN-dependent dehydrogenase